jgi:hypothetical protein
LRLDGLTLTVVVAVLAMGVTMNVTGTVTGVAPVALRVTAPL